MCIGNTAGDGNITQCAQHLSKRSPSVFSRLVQVQRQLQEQGDITFYIRDYQVSN